MSLDDIIWYAMNVQKTLGNMGFIIIKIVMDIRLKESSY